MSHTAQISATGASCIKYTFTTYPLGTQFTAVGGVYLILKLNAVLYVGQTCDLSARFDAHHKESCWHRHQADRMAVMGVANESQRLQIEADLIEAYNPVCNG